MNSDVFRLTKIIDNPSERKILFYFNFFDSHSDAHKHLDIDREILTKKIEEFVELNLVEVNDKGVKLTRHGKDVIKADIITLNTFFELLELTMNDLNFKEYIFKKSKVPCMYYGAIARAMKLLLYFLHISNETECDLSFKDLESIINHSGCEFCNSVVVALTHDEVFKPVVEGKRQLR